MAKTASIGVLHDWAPGTLAEIYVGTGDLSGLEVFGSNVLIGAYQRATRTKSGLITPQGATDDAWTGKCGAVLKIGPTAFQGKDDAETERLRRIFGGRFPEVGEWVFHEIHASVQFSFMGPGGSKPPGRDDPGWPVRLVYATDILGRIKDPNSVVCDMDGKIKYGVSIKNVGAEPISIRPLLGEALGLETCRIGVDGVASAKTEILNPGETIVHIGYEPGIVHKIEPVADPTQPIGQWAAPVVPEKPIDAHSG